VFGLRVRGHVRLLRLFPDRGSNAARAHDYDVDPVQEQLAAQTVREPFQAELGCVVGSDEGSCDLPADRADIDDSSGGRGSCATNSQKPHESLCDDKRADEIDLELSLEFAHGLVYEGPGASNACVIHQAAERLSLEEGLHFRSRPTHRLLVGDVEEQGMEARTELRGDPLGIRWLTHAAKYTKALLDENFGRAPADTGGNSRDDYGSHRVSTSKIHCVYLHYLKGISSKEPRQEIQ